MKFRVIKKEGLYIPQCKHFLFWQEIATLDFEYNEGMHKAYLTLPDAVDFINSLVQRKPAPVVWQRDC